MQNKNRGMLLEKIINQTINYYQTNELAFIEKKSLPIKFSEVKKGSELSNAKIFGKSTVDYIGCLKGKFIAFEAKSTQENKLPSKNIKTHQIKYLLSIKKNGGKSFFIIFFEFCDEFYIVDAQELINNLKKSISYEEIKKIGLKIELTFPGIIDFLPYVENMN